MKYISVRDLHARPKRARESLERDGQVVLTSNGEPFGLLITVNSENLSEKIAALRQAEAMRLVNSMRLQSIERGNDDMRLEEINAEIDAARRERA
ncbi:hypothetical protein LJC74_10480 [Eubacteriales bacterium OttesenSCG-928-A19]|nr:hypothetical protein [Eubacteriales bacterium OttesenSCG-928-A19]